MALHVARREAFSEAPNMFDELQLSPTDLK